MNKECKFWKHKYDFSEINSENYKKVIKQYFNLNIKKITILSMLFAVEIVMVVVSKFVMGNFLILGVFAIEISFFPIFCILIVSNVFYTSVLSLIAIWFRLGLGSEPIGLLSMTITDESFIFSFSLFFFILKKCFLFKFENKNFVYCLLMSLSVVVASIISGAIAFICNYYFIFDLYKVPPASLLLWVGFGVTIIKFILNFVIFMSFWKSFKLLVESSRI